MAGAVKTVGVGPLLHGFFAVGPDEPDAVAIAFLAAQVVGVFEEDGGGRPAVVGADESHIAQRVVGVVVAHDDDDAVFFAGKFGDDVVDGELAFHGVGGKDIVFNLIALKMAGDVALKFLVVLAAQIAGTEGGDLAGVLEGARGINVRERGVIGRHGLGRRLGRRGRFGFWEWIGGAGFFGAGYGVCLGDGQQQSHGDL